MEALEKQNGKGVEKTVDRNAFSATQMFNLKLYSPFAMTIMDEICGWENEEKRVGSKFATCMWIYTKEVFTSGQITHSRNGGVLEAASVDHCAMH